MIARCIFMHTNDFLYRNSSIRGVVIRRLIGELIVYEGVRRPSIVSTFSNDISSEAEKPILFIFHIYIYRSRNE